LDISYGYPKGGDSHRHCRQKWSRLTWPERQKARKRASAGEVIPHHHHHPHSNDIRATFWFLHSGVSISSMTMRLLRCQRGQQSPTTCGGFRRRRGTVTRVAQQTRNLEGEVIITPSTSGTNVEAYRTPRQLDDFTFKRWGTWMDEFLLAAHALTRSRALFTPMQRNTGRLPGTTGTFSPSLRRPCSSS
jgi:hypothetical protein